MTKDVFDEIPTISTFAAIIATSILQFWQAKKEKLKYTIGLIYLQLLCLHYNFN